MKPLLSEDPGPGVRKLTRGEIDAIVRELARHRHPVYHIARVHHVTPKWMREIRRRSMRGLPLPGDQPLGRPPKPRNPDETELILAAERRHRLHLLALERLLDEEYGTHIVLNALCSSKGFRGAFNTHG